MDVFLHSALLLYVIYGILTGNAAFMLTALASILLHEGAHAFAAFLFGQPPSCIEITPLGAVMRLEDENRLPPSKRAIMLAAGPVMTFLLCCISIKLTQVSVLSLKSGRLIFLSNLSILLLNLLPALPLDGGRLFSLLLGIFMKPKTAGRIVRTTGSILGIGMIALNIYTSLNFGGWNLSLAFVGCCLMYSAAIATTTHAMAELRWFMDRKITLERKGFQSVKWFSVLHTQQLRVLVRLLPPRKTAMYACIETGSMKLMGWISEYEAVQLYLQKPEMNLAEAVRLCRHERTD